MLEWQSPHRRYDGVQEKAKKEHRECEEGELKKRVFPLCKLR